MITLIGATTENPYFEVNSALLSRAQVYELEPLSVEELETVVRRGAAELGAEIPDDSLRLHRHSRRRRRALRRTTSSSSRCRQRRPPRRAAPEAHVDDAARKRPLLYDKTADAHYDFISAFIKSMRGSDPDAAVYYLAAMLEGGEDARFIARRMIVLASEDIGNADPRALLVAVAAAQAVEHVGLPEARLNLSQAAIYLARAPKSNASYEAIKRATKDVQERGNIRPPKALADGSYYGRKLGKGEGYVYPHSDPARIRRRLPAGRAEGDDVLRAVRQRRGDDRTSRSRGGSAGPQARRTCRRPSPSLVAARSTSYSTRRNSNSPSSPRSAYAARTSPSSGMPALPGLMSVVPFWPGLRNCWWLWPKTTVLSRTPFSIRSSSSPGSGGKLSTSDSGEPCT